MPRPLPGLCLGVLGAPCRQRGSPQCQPGTGPSPPLTHRARQQLCTHSLAQSPLVWPCCSPNCASVSPSVSYCDTCLAAGPGRGARRCGLGRAAAQARASQASAARAGSHGGQALRRSATRGSAGDGGAVIRLQGQRRRSPRHHTSYAPSTFPAVGPSSRPTNAFKENENGAAAPQHRDAAGGLSPASGSSPPRCTSRDGDGNGLCQAAGAAGLLAPSWHLGRGTTHLPGPPTQPRLGGLGGCAW